MSTEFEFHLDGASAPQGQLDADHLVAIVSSLREVASKIGRVETDAEAVGRAPKRVHRVAKLFIGLAPGSTSVLARRAGEATLDFDLPDEQAFDQSFQALVESIADDRRPSWVGDSLAIAARDLTSALQQAAPQVQFKVDGTLRRSFRTESVHRETWHVTTTRDSESITFVGRLYAANLNSHRLDVQDDVGNKVGLPDVDQDTQIATLLGSYVAVSGSPVVDAAGRLTHISSATIEAVPDLLDDALTDRVVPLDEILASAPGPDPDGGIEMTEEEWGNLWAALHT